MVTWWLIGQEEQRRDSLTGINMVRSEGSLQSQKRKNSIPATKSEGSLLSQKNGSIQNDVTVVAKTSEGSLSSRRQSYSKIVSFNGGGHSPNSSSSQEQLDQNLPLPGTVVTDNEPLLL